MPTGVFMDLDEGRYCVCFTGYLHACVHVCVCFTGYLHACVHVCVCFTGYLHACVHAQDVLHLILPDTDHFWM